MRSLIFLLVALATTVKGRFVKIARCNCRDSESEASASDASFFGSSGIWTAPLSKVIIAVISCTLWGVVVEKTAKYNSSNGDGDGLERVVRGMVLGLDSSVRGMLPPGGVRVGDIRANPCQPFKCYRNTTGTLAACDGAGGQALAVPKNTSGPNACRAWCNSTTLCTFWRFVEIPVQRTQPQQQLCSLHNGVITTLLPVSNTGWDRFTSFAGRQFYHGIKSETQLDSREHTTDGGCRPFFRPMVMVCYFPVALLTLIAALCLHGTFSRCGRSRAAAQRCTLAVVPFLMVTAVLEWTWQPTVPTPEQQYGDPQYEGWLRLQNREMLAKAVVVVSLAFCVLFLVAWPRRSLLWNILGLLLFGVSQLVFAVTKGVARPAPDEHLLGAYAAWESYGARKNRESMIFFTLSLVAAVMGASFYYRFTQAQKKGRKGMKDAKDAYSAVWASLPNDGIGDFDRMVKQVKKTWKPQVQAVFPEKDDGFTMHLARRLHIYPASEFVELYRQAHKAQPALLKKASEWAGQHGGTHVPGKVKDPVRALQKTFRSYGGDSRKLCDLARTTITFKSFKEMTSCLEHINSDVQQLGDALFQKTSKKMQNRFDEDYEPSDGYRDMQLRVGIGGHVCEIQMHIRAMHDKYKHEGWHQKYKNFRDLMTT
jgi:hypothetical protein